MGGGSIGTTPSYAGSRYGFGSTAEESGYKPLTHYTDEGGEDKPKVCIIYHTSDLGPARLLGYQLEDERYGVNAIDNSPKKRYEGDWEKPMDKKIYGSDAVIVMVGKRTYTRPAVRTELRMAKRHGKPVYAVKIKRDNEIPQAVYDAGGKVINWDMDRIKYEVHYNT